jgi:hypothetical protein
MPADKLPAWVTLFRPDELWRSAITLPWSREDLPMLIASVDHQRWKKSVYTYLADTTGSLPLPGCDPQECRFGRWHDGQGQRSYQSFADFAALGPLHQQIHLTGRELVERGHDEALLQTFESLNTALTEHLRKLQAEVLLAHQASKR